MTNIADVRLPAQMDPDLAHILAHHLLNLAPETPDGLYLALCLLHASWVVEGETDFGEYVSYLVSQVFSPSLRVKHQQLAASGFYTAQAEARNVSTRVLLRSQLAAVTWSELLEELDYNEGAGKKRIHRLLNEVLMARSEDLVDEVQQIVEDFADDEGFDMEDDDQGDADVPRVTIMLENLKASEPAFRDEYVETLRQRLPQLLDEITKELKPGEASATEGLLAGGPHLQVFSSAIATEALRRVLGPPVPGEGNSQQVQLLKQLSRDSGVRALVEVPAGNPLQALYGRFPHFKPVLDFVNENLALAACGEEGQPVRIAPILLRGTPGTGKTYFAQELARVLGTEFLERDLSVTTEAFVLSGMDPSWKGSKLGVVGDALINGKTANPLICLNEVDKSNGRGSQNPPIAAMYALLEPASAARFTDEFVPVPLDASRIIWVLTANDGPIPEPVLSRLEVFDIPEPTKEQARAIAQSVWDRLCNGTLPRGHGFVEKLDDDVLEVVSAVSPRRMRKVLARAASAAVLRGRKQVLREDLTESRAQANQQRRIGFIVD